MTPHNNPASRRSASMPSVIVATAAATALASWLLVTMGASRGSAPPPKCVGMFIAEDRGLTGTIPRETPGLTVRGTVPCMATVSAWMREGPYRVFEDGTVEFLASPEPVCPGGDYYVWVAYPNPR